MSVYHLSWVGDHGWAGVGDGFYQLQAAYGLTLVQEDGAAGDVTGPDGGDGHVGLHEGAHDP